MLFTGGRLSTFRGTRLRLCVPSPSRPSWPCPQHQASPDVVTPHVCSKRALTSTKTRFPATGVGTRRSTFVPSPSCPAGFAPQQYALPAVVTPQVCQNPAAICLNVSPPTTRTGASLHGKNETKSVQRPVSPANADVPSCPFALAPQHHA